MEINLVVLNVGNSRLAVAPFRAGELGEVVRLDLNEPAAWGPAISNAWKQIAGRDNAAVVGASVNPDLDEPVEQAVLDAVNRHVVWVGEDLDLPIKVLTDQPEETGVDRVLNVAAAYEQVGKACVVVDAGTAVTVDYCNDQGEFVEQALGLGANDYWLKGTFSADSLEQWLAYYLVEGKR
jgi:type III pantothenate kinase